MADNTVDSILIEIEAPAEKAKGGLEQIKKSLQSMKDATQGINIEKLKDTANAIEKISQAGEGAKNAGQGIRSIIGSVKSLEGISSNRLKKVADAIQKISSSLGNMGNNNKISIKIDSEGIQKAITPLENVKDAMQKSILEPYEQFEAKLQNVGKGFTFSGTGTALASEIEKAEAKLDSLLAKEQKMQTMGTADKDSSTYRNLQYDIAEICNKLETLYSKQQAEAEVAANVATAIEDEGNSAKKAANTTTKLSDEEENAAQSANKAADAQENLNDSLKNGNGAKTATSRIEELIKKINQYKATISNMENGKLPFNFDAYKEAVQGLQSAKIEFDRFKKSLQDSQGFINSVANYLERVGQAARDTGLEHYGNVLTNISKKLSEVESGSAGASAEMRSMGTSLPGFLQVVSSVISAAARAIKSLISTIKKVEDATKKTIKNIVSKVKSGISKVRSALAGLKNWLAGFFKNIKQNLGIQDKSIGDLTKKLKSFMRLFSFMALRKAFTALFSNIGNSFNLLAKYSDMMGTRFNKNVSLIVSDAKWLSNSVIAAFEPLINAITPLIDALITKLVSAIDVANQFFSALTGSKTWTKAKKNVENYAAGLDKTTDSAKKVKKEIKEIKDLTTDLDELNILRQEDEDEDDDYNTGIDTGDNAVNPADYFETKDVDQKWKDLADWIKDMWKDGDFTALGKFLGDKLAEALANIPWDKIKQNARKLGKALATLLNGFIQGEFDGKSVSWWLGHTLAEAVNTAFEFLNSFISHFDWAAHGKALTDFVKGFLESIDWALIFDTLIKLGEGIADYLNAVFSDYEMWLEVGQAFANAINAIILFAKAFVDKFNFGQFGTAIALGLGRALVNISWSDLFTTLTSLLNGLFEALGKFAETFPWMLFAKNIANGINDGLNNLNWETIENGLKKFCEGLGRFINTFLKELDFTQLALTIVKGINVGFKAIDSLLDEIQFEEIAQKVVDALNAAISYFAEHASQWGRTANKLIKGLCTVINKVIDETDWVTLFKAVSDALEEIDWSPLLKTVFKAFAGQWTFKNLFRGVIWSEIGKGTLDALGETLNEDFGKKIGTKIGDAFNYINWAGIKTRLVKVANGLFETLKGIFALIDWKQYGKDVVNGIGILFENIDWSNISRSLSVFIRALQRFVIDVIKTIDWQELPRQIIEGIKEFFSGIDVEGLAKGFGEFFATLVKINGDLVIGLFKDFLADIWKQISDYFSDRTHDYGDIALGFFIGIRDAFGNLAAWVIEHIVVPFIDGFKKGFGIASPSKVMAKIGGYIIDGLWEGIKAAWSVFWSKLVEKIASLKDVFSAFDDIRSITKEKFDLVKSVISEKLSLARDKASEVVESIKTNLGNAWNAIKTNTLTNWDGIKNAVSNRMTEVKDSAITSAFSLCEKVSTEWKNLKTSTTTVAGEMVESFKNKIASSYINTRSAMTTWAEKIREWFSSDSIGAINTRTWSNFAQTIVSSFANKITNNHGETRSPIGTWATNLRTWFTNGSYGAINGSKWSNYAAEIITGFKDKITSGHSATSSPITTWAANLKTWFSNSSYGSINNSKWTSYASEIINGFRDKIINGHSVTSSPMTTWATNLKEWFNGGSYGAINNSKWTSYASEIINGFKDKITNGHNATQSPITTWAANIKNWFSGSSYGAINSATWQGYALDLITGFKNKLSYGASTIQSTITSWASNIKNWFSGNSYGAINNSTWQNYANNLIEGFKDKISNGHGDSKSPIEKWASNITSWFSGSGLINSTTWKGYASDVITGFKDKISSGNSAAQGPMESFASNVKSWFERSGDQTLVQRFKAIGVNIVQGFIDGVNSLWDMAMKRIKEFGESVIAEGKKGTQEKSPSRAFRQIGSFVVQGFNLGLDDEMASTFNKMGEWLSGINGALTVTPRIKVDTSDLKNYSTNYGTEFTDAAITHKIQREMDFNSSMQAEIDGGRFSEGMRKVIIEELAPYLSDIRSDTKRQADKKEMVNVEIGRRTVKDAVIEQRSADGFNFTPSFA